MTNTINCKHPVKKIISKVLDIIGTIFAILAIALCVYILTVNYTCSKTGDDPFYFGYRPCLIQTGSMEPYLKTNGIIMTKHVTELEEVEVGDVVTYKTKNSDGKTIYITHRIINITEDGYIITKGDNNHVDDGFALTMDNVIAKTVGVYNQPSVWIIGCWQSGFLGKIVIICICLAIICFCSAISTIVSSLLDYSEEETSEEEKNGESSEDQKEANEQSENQQSNTEPMITDMSEENK